MTNPPRPFAAHDIVGHGESVIRSANDYFQSCGREPMRSGAEADLKKKIAARGVVESCEPGPCAPWVVSVRWTDGTVSQCLPHRVKKAPPIWESAKPDEQTRILDNLPMDVRGTILADGLNYPPLRARVEQLLIAGRK